jgi:hypothetical protein
MEAPDAHGVAVSGGSRVIVTPFPTNDAARRDRYNVRHRQMPPI